MITIKDLEICAALAREARDIKDRMKALRSMAEGTGPRYSHAPGGSGKTTDRVGEIVADLDELERKYHARVMAYLRHVECVETAIDEIEDPDVRTVLRLRYIDGLIWDEVALKAYWSIRKCRALHNEGLAFFGIDLPGFADQDAV